MIKRYDDGTARDHILRKLRELSSGVAAAFPYSVELDVGSAFSKAGTSKLVASFLSGHGNEKVGELLRSGQINVLDLMSNGAISIGAKSLDVRRFRVGKG